MNEYKHEPQMTPFYKKVKDNFQTTQIGQIVKGAKKYDEPFNPESWTPLELLKHGLEEAVDLTTYLVGLYDKVEELEKENAVLREQLKKQDEKVNEGIQRLFE